MMLHKLSLLETPPYAKGLFRCNLCWERGSGQVYHCSDCHFDIHITCAALAKQQTHFSHYQHPLYLCHCSPLHVCDGCGENIHKFAFRCDTCDFDMHSLCARAPRFIQHPAHAHPLMLSKSSEFPGLCNACGKETVEFSYRCHRCDYRLHQFCATLPSRIKHLNHPQHMLTLLRKSPQGGGAFQCDQCGEKGTRWCFACLSCGFYAHPCCTNILHELPHPDLEVSRSNAITSSSSVVQHNVLDDIGLSQQDLEAVEKFLRFARETVNGPPTQSTDASESSLSNEVDTCPTCLEGYGPGNPKRSTSCGHHFHLACILEWMERSSRCPICRKSLNIMM